MGPKSVEKIYSKTKWVNQNISLETHSPQLSESIVKIHVNIS